MVGRQAETMEALVQIPLGPQSCAHPLVFVGGMIDLCPTQQISSRHVNEESYLNSCVLDQWPNLVG